MALLQNSLRNKTKKMLFEYFVFLLNEWKLSINNRSIPAFTKLRLQKLLFLACTINASITDLRLLSVFDRFSALPYGPVELDIYAAMNDNSFYNIKFKGNDCLINESFSKDVFADLDPKYKTWLDDAIKVLKVKRLDYLDMPVFNLVGITHQWTAWQTANTVAELLGCKSEPMLVDDICNSKVKAY